MFCPICGNECPKCELEYELVDVEPQEDICAEEESFDDESLEDEALNEESLNMAPVVRSNGLLNRRSSRFSVNQALVLIGCILMFLSLSLDFISSPSASWGNVHSSFFVFANYGSGLSLIFGIGGFGFNSSDFIELLVPLVAVAVLTIFTKKINNNRFMVVSISIMGLYFALTRLSGLMRGGPFSMMQPGIGLIIFVWLWVIITMLSIFEYKNIHIFEKALVRARE